MQDDAATTNEPEGLGIEIAGLAEVGFFLAVLVPGYWWVSKAEDQKVMFERGALVGTGLLALAIGLGLRQRQA